MTDIYVLIVAAEQEKRRLPRRSEALDAELRIADDTGVVGSTLMSALRCAVFDDPFLRVRAKQEESRATNH